MMKLEHTNSGTRYFHRGVDQHSFLSRNVQVVRVTCNRKESNISICYRAIVNVHNRCSRWSMHIPGIEHNRHMSCDLLFCCSHYCRMACQTRKINVWLVKSYHFCKKSPKWADITFDRYLSNHDIWRTFWVGLVPLTYFRSVVNTL